MKNRIINQRQSGQAAILIVFVLGMISLFIGISLVQTGFSESVMGRANAASLSAFYLANSGIEEAFYKLNHNASYGDTAAGSSFSLDLNGNKAEVKVYTVDPVGEPNLRTIESAAKTGSYLKKIKATTEKSSLKPGFAHAVWAGIGGFELENSSEIAAIGGGEGNVFSNNSVWGKSQSCGNSGSRINGTVWAVDSITKLSGGGSDGVCITEEAYADKLDYCFVGGDAFSSTVSADCNVVGTWTNQPAPTPADPPDMNIEELKTRVKDKKTFTGDCIIGATIGCYAVNNGVATVGDIYITGNLVKPNSTDLNFSGPVYVEGNIEFGSNSTVSLDDSLDGYGISQIVVAKGKIISASNITYATRTVMIDGTPVKMFLMFIADDEPPGGDMCSDPAITLSSNSDSVLFYAKQGCLLVNANTEFYGAILGQKVRVENNSAVYYDPDLQTAEFGTTKSGGWLTLTFKEE